MLYNVLEVKNKLIRDLLEANQRTSAIVEELVELCIENGLKDEAEIIAFGEPLLD